MPDRTRDVWPDPDTMVRHAVGCCPAAHGGKRPAGPCPDVASAGAAQRLYLEAVTTYSAVVTTGIYCRPGCSATPLAENVRTFELAASAEAAGFRACLRCRPYRVAGPLASGAPELVCRAVQLIIDGVLDAGTEAMLAARLAVSPRHLRRIFTGHLGVTPDQLARSRRAHFARRLLDDTDLTVADVAFASGFASLRQFNRLMRECSGPVPASCAPAGAAPTGSPPTAG
jgi:AraC family transcriptional regulator of adaptative response / DNA-3-methyladenine glycosylase II